MLTRARPARAPYSGRPQGLAGRSLGVPWSGSGAAATAGCQPECSIYSSSAFCVTVRRSRARRGPGPGGGSGRVSRPTAILRAPRRHHDRRRPTPSAPKRDGAATGRAALTPARPHKQVLRARGRAPPQHDHQSQSLARWHDSDVAGTGTPVHCTWQVGWCLSAGNPNRDSSGRDSGGHHLSL